MNMRPLLDETIFCFLNIFGTFGVRNQFLILIAVSLARL